MAAPIRVEARAAMLGVRPEDVYSILADYHEGHPSILPIEYLSDLVVEKGGIGDGTVIRFNFKAGGRVMPVRAEVKEPEPGRVLSETDTETGAVTTFTVTPLQDQLGAEVEISTVWMPSGFMGFVARLFAPRLLRRVYALELANLARVAVQKNM